MGAEMRKIQLLRFLVMGLVILLNFMLQPIIFSHMTLQGVVPNIFIVTIVSTALLRGKTEGLIVGLIIGLTQDVLYGSVFGLYGIIYMLIGFFIGDLYGNFYRESLLVPIAVIAGVDMAKNIMIYFFTFLFRGRLSFYPYIGQIILPEMLYTVFIGFLLYRIYYTINYYIEAKEELKENDR